MRGAAPRLIHITVNSQEFSNEITGLSKEANGYTYDCERNSQTAMAKWIEERRSQARVPIHVDPKGLEPYVGQYQCNSTRVLTVTRRAAGC